MLTSPASSVWRRVGPAACAGLFFALMLNLWLGGELLIYNRIIRLWGVAPFRTPFEDTETVMSALRCLRSGVDVLLTNPCDPEHRIFDYSPLWLTLAALPVTKAWLVPAGLMVDGAFVASLLLLPPARETRGAGLVCLGAVSSGVVFAMERGNNDLVIFVLVSAGASLLARDRPLSIAGYAFLFLAGLLKYYPMATMALALQERPRRFFALLGASLAGVAMFAALSWHDLTRALALIPTDTAFGDMFGSVNLAKGLVEELRLSKTMIAPLRFVMIAGALVLAARSALRGRDEAALVALSPRERQFLLTGALLIAGCFFTAQNIGYRVVQLLLLLPALVQLGVAVPTRRRRWLAPVALVLMWSELWRKGLLAAASAMGGPPLHGVFRDSLFLVKEIAWWWLIIELTELILASALGSKMARGLHFTRRSASSTGGH